MRISPQNPPKRKDGLQVDHEVPPQAAQEVPRVQVGVPEREQAGKGWERF